MKKFYTLQFMLLMLFSIQAQQSDNVTLNIILRPIQTITVNPLQKTVNLIYDSVDKYEQGDISRQTEHLEIFSSGGFAVQVSGTSFEMDGDIKIIADPVQPNPTYSFTSVDLSQTPTDLIVGGRGGRQQFNVTYDNSSGANKYFDKEYKSYSVEVEYTILPR
jgi:hypothetical protein